MLVGVLCSFADHFYSVFVSSSGGSEARSVDAGAVETQFSVFEPASKKHGFFWNVQAISGVNGFQV